MKDTIEYNAGIAGYTWM